MPRPPMGDAAGNPAAASPVPGDPLTWDLPGVLSPTLCCTGKAVFFSLTASLPVVTSDTWTLLQPPCSLSYMLLSAALFLPVGASLSPTAHLTAQSSHLSRHHFSFPWREVRVVLGSHSHCLKRPTVGKRHCVPAVLTPETTGGE